MKEIPLTQGKVALVDDEDYEFLMQWKWCAHFKGHTSYSVRNIYIGKINGKKRTKTIPMHRVIMNPSNIMQIDHINHNGLDNRKENLRIVTIRENGQNRKVRKELLGTEKANKKYRARLRIGNTPYYLGVFPTPEEAHSVYMKAANELIKIARELKGEAYIKAATTLIKKERQQYLINHIVGKEVFAGKTF